MGLNRIVISFALLLLPCSLFGQKPVFVTVNARAAYTIESTELDLACLPYSHLGSLSANGYHISFGADFFKKEFFHIGCDAGFRHEYFRFKDYERPSGIYLNTIPLELSCKISNAFRLGVSTDILVNAKIVESRQFSLVGLYQDCFNKATLSPFVEYSFFPLDPFFSAFVRYNIPIISQFNYDKIEYYNMRDAGLRFSLYVEFGLAFRVFTTGKRQISFSK